MAELEKRDTFGNGGAEEDEEEEKFLDGVVLDFDMLCSTVAMQTQGKWSKLDNLEYDDGGELGGVLRMWEGELLDCFEDRRIALESTCCPCYRFGKNMGRAGFGSWFIQIWQFFSPKMGIKCSNVTLTEQAKSDALRCCTKPKGPEVHDYTYVEPLAVNRMNQTGTVYFILAAAALFNCIAFIVTKKHYFMYLGVALAISIGTYLGFYRTQIRKKFNIKHSDSSLDDCVYHMICPCCSLCQESRTLEMNNVQDGTWHGRGDTICVGGYGEGSKGFFELCPPPIMSTQSPEPCSIQKSPNADDHSWTLEVGHAAPSVSLPPFQ